MPLILIISKLPGLITCKGSGRSQSATQLWPKISAGFVLAERRIQDKWGRSARARCHQVRCDVRHCAMECDCFGAKTLTMCSVFLEPRVMREVSAWSQWQDGCTTTVHEKNVCAVGVLFTHFGDPEGGWEEQEEGGEKSLCEAAGRQTSSLTFRAVS